MPIVKIGLRDGCEVWLPWLCARNLNECNPTIFCSKMLFTHTEWIWMNEFKHLNWISLEENMRWKGPVNWLFKHWHKSNWSDLLINPHIDNPKAFIQMPKNITTHMRLLSWKWLVPSYDQKFNLHRCMWHKRISEAMTILTKQKPQHDTRVWGTAFYDLSKG